MKIERLKLYKKSSSKEKAKTVWLLEFYQGFKALILIIFKSSKRIKEEGIFPNSFCKARVKTLIPKPDKDIIGKANYNPILPMNVDAKILIHILANWIQQYIEK